MAQMVQADNATIINAVRSNAGLDYRSRIPITTQGSLADTLGRMLDYQPDWNMFKFELLNRIGLTLYNSNNFVNPLKPFKSANVNWGSTLQEIGSYLIKGEQYDPDDTNPFVAPKPEIAVQYHEQNRESIYPMRINDNLLKQAFLSEGELSTFVNGLLAQPMQSDEWDEYLMMMGLLKEYHEINGFSTIKVPDLINSADPKEDADTLAEIMRAVYEDSKFYNKKYNAIGMDTVSKELNLLMTPRFAARFDVRSLAVAYHMDKADFLADRVVMVQDFDIPGAQAMLIDRDFFKCSDTLVKMTSDYNAKADENVYFLHHRGIYGASLMRNAILFSSVDNDSIVIPPAAKVPTTVTVTAGTIEDNQVLLTPVVTYDDGTTDTNVYFRINEETPGTPTSDAFVPDTATFIDWSGTLHINPRNNWSTITVTAYSTVDSTKFGSVSITVPGAEAQAASAPVAKMSKAKS